jgi:hypothetical protein
MLPFTTLMLRFSLSPIEFARAYCEAFASAAPSVPPKLVAPRLDPSNGAATAVAPRCSGNRVPSDQSGNSGKVMSNQFYDSQVATVSYQILFTKRDNEALLDSETTTVAKTMTGNGFASWKIAEFIRKDEDLEKPEAWSDDDYDEFTEVVDSKHRLKEEYLEFLQVDYQIISTFDRKAPRYDQDQVAVLRKIADAIEKNQNPNLASAQRGNPGTRPK